MMISKRTLLVASLLGALATGCATMGDRGQPLVPTQHQVRTGPFVVFTNYPLPADDGTVKALAGLQGEVEETLGFHVDAGDHPIEVYILSDRKAYEHFLTFYYPELPQRRAFFISQNDRRVVYTFKGDRLEEDIRHESTHALLNLAIGVIPLWLDEGLAEYFEAIGPTGLNREHLARLRRDTEEGWKPDLARLETLTTVKQMTPRDYREAWAWSHYLLNESGDGRAALLAFLGDLRKAQEAKPLSARLAIPASASSIALAAHIDKIRAVDPPKVATPAPTVRLQDGPIEIEVLSAPPRKKGFFTRLFSRLIP
jgi:hypothetical protein